MCPEDTICIALADIGRATLFAGMIFGLVFVLVVIVALVGWFEGSK